MWPVQCSNVQPGVVLRKERIAAVAENRFHEIEIANQAARREESDLHPFFRRHALNPRANQRPQQERYERLDRFGPIGGVRQGEHVARRLERAANQASVGLLRRRLLVGRNRQAPFAHVERAAGGAAIVQWIVQHAVPQAIGEDQFIAEGIAIDRQRKLSGDSVAVERQRPLRQPQRGLARHVGKVLVQESLDPPIDRAAGIVQQQEAFTKCTQHFLGVGRGGRGILQLYGREAAGDQLQIDVAPQPLLPGRKSLRRLVGQNAQRTFQFLRHTINLCGCKKSMI